METIAPDNPSVHHYQRKLMEQHVAKISQMLQVSLSLGVGEEGACTDCHSGFQSPVTTGTEEETTQKESCGKGEEDEDEIGTPWSCLC